MSVKIKRKFSKALSFLLVFTLVLSNIISIGVSAQPKPVTIEVERYDDREEFDPEDPTLRQAIEELANEGDTVKITRNIHAITATTIYLNREIVIDKNMIIEGFKTLSEGVAYAYLVGRPEGDKDTTNSHRIFNHTSTGELKISDIQFNFARSPHGKDGEAPGEDGTNGENGGAIYSKGTVVLANSTFSGNQTGDGGNGADSGENGNGGNGGSAGDGSCVYAEKDITVKATAKRMLTLNLTGAGGSGGVGKGTGHGGHGGNGGNGGSFYAIGTVTIESGIAASENGAGGAGGAALGNGNGGNGGNAGYGGIAYTKANLTVTGEPYLMVNTFYAGGNGGNALGTGNGGNGGHGRNGGSFYAEGDANLSYSMRDPSDAQLDSKASDGGNGGESENGIGGNAGNGGHGGEVFSLGNVTLNEAHLTYGFSGTSGKPGNELIATRGQTGTSGSGGSVYATKDFISAKSSISGSGIGNPNKRSGNNGNGGGAYVGGNADVKDTLFWKNGVAAAEPIGAEVEQGGDGGGLYVEGTAIISENSAFRGNYSGSIRNDGKAGRGGGIYVNGEAQISDTLFHESMAGQAITVHSGSPYQFNSGGDGGAAYFNGKATISRSVFELSKSGGFLSNASTALYRAVKAGNGGAIYSNSEIHIDHSIFKSNATGNAELPGDGGAVYSKGLIDAKNTSFINNSITYEVARPDFYRIKHKDLGAGAAVYSDTNVVLTNSTVGGSESKYGSFLNAEESNVTGSVVASNGKVYLIHTTVADSKDATGVAVTGGEENIITLNAYSGGHKKEEENLSAFIPSLPQRGSYLADKWEARFEATFSEKVIESSAYGSYSTYGYTPTNDGLNQILTAKPLTASDFPDGFLPVGVLREDILKILERDQFGEVRTAKIGNVVTFGSVETEYIEAPKTAVDIKVELNPKTDEYYIGSAVELKVLIYFNKGDPEYALNEQFELYYNDKVTSLQELLASRGEKVVTVVYTDETATISKDITIKVVEKPLSINAYINGTIIDDSFECFVGDQIALAVKLVLQSGEEEIENYDINIPVSELAKEVGTKKVVIFYNEKGLDLTKEFNLVVKERPIVAEKLTVIPSITPEKDEYLVGEDLDIKLTVKLAKSDGSEITLTPDKYTVSHDLSKITDKAGEKEVVVTFNDDPNLKDSFNVKVKPKLVIENLKESYYVGETFDETKLRVKLLNDINVGEEDITYNLTPKDYTFTNEDLIRGYKAFVVTATEGEKTYVGDFKVTIKDKEIWRIEVTKKPDKIIYLQNDNFDIEGLEVKVFYLGSIPSKTLTHSEYTLSVPAGTKLDTPGSKVVKVTLKSNTSFSDTFTFEVLAINGIKIETLPKTKYTEGERLNLNGLSVVYTYEKTTETRPCDKYTTTPTDNTELTVEDKVVTVKSAGFETTFNIDVDKKPVVVTSIRAEAKYDTDKAYVGSADLEVDLTVYAKYSDGSEKLLNSDEYTLSHNLNTLINKSGLKTIKVTYNKEINIQDTFTVDIDSVIVIENAKKSYYQGETFRKDKLTVKLLSDMSVGAVAVDYALNPDSYIFTKNDLITGFKDFDVTVSGDSKTYKSSFKVTVNEQEIDYIKVKERPNRINYLEGDLLSTAGLVVELFYKGEIPSRILDPSEYKVIPRNGTILNIAGINTILVTLNSESVFMDTFTVDVAALIGIKVKESPSILDYTEGDKLDLTGLTVVYIFEGTDETRECIDFFTLPSDGIILTLNDTVITIKSGEFETDFEIVVKEKEKEKANKKELEHLLTFALLFEFKKDKYILRTFEPFERSLKEAKRIAADTHATQKEVDDIWEELVTDLVKLRLIPDKSILKRTN